MDYNQFFPVLSSFQLQVFVITVERKLEHNQYALLEKLHIYKNIHVIEMYRKNVV